MWHSLLNNGGVGCMQKHIYTTPELEIITFITDDVITESGSGDVEEPQVTAEPSQPVLPWDE